jgi:hypothetical protein
VQYGVAREDSTEPSGASFRRGAVLVEMRALHRVRLAVDGGAARGTLVLDLPARPGETPQFQPGAEGDFGLRVDITLAGTPAEHAWEWERRTTRTLPLWDPALAEPLPQLWRELALDREMARLPGGGDRLAALRQVVARLPEGAPGRTELAGLIGEYVETLRLMDAFRTAARAHAAAEAALARARRALEDRTGAEREPARAALNAASVAAERSGRAADTAWNAWRAAAQRVVAWGG